MSGIRTIGDRFRDPMVRVYRFADEVLARCPACGGCAVVRGLPRTPGCQACCGCRMAHRRLSCLGCGLAKDRPVAGRALGGPVDPDFRLPLWLRTECRGEVLWAYNAEHLDVLESYVAARLRERVTFPCSMSMMARLPLWMKLAKNRDEVLRGVRRLRASLPTAQR